MGSFGEVLMAHTDFELDPLQILIVTFWALGLEAADVGAGRQAEHCRAVLGRVDAVVVVTA